MGEQLRALVVSSHEDLFNRLQQALDRIGILSELAPTCGHARAILEQPNPPALVFTDSILPDGTCSGVIGMAAQATVPARVIVISEVVDYETFMDVMEAGAADFIAPPFSSADLAWIICSVMENEAKLGNRAA